VGEGGDKYKVFFVESTTEN
jgi:hypothetical protein